jgi:WD40 repeat protein
MPGGKVFVIGGATVASAETGEAIHTVADHTGDAAHPERGQASAPLFLGEGKRFVTVGKKDLKVVVWDTEKGQQADTFSLTDCEEVMTNAVTPDGKKLVTFHENGENVVWDVERGKREVVLAEQEGNVLHTGAVAVSGDGKRVAAVVNPPNGELKLKVWDVKSGKLLLTKENVGPQTVCFDAAGRVAVCDGSLKKIVFHTVPE